MDFWGHSHGTSWHQGLFSTKKLSEAKFNALQINGVCNRRPALEWKTHLHEPVFLQGHFVLQRPPLVTGERLNVLET